MAERARWILACAGVALGALHLSLAILLFPGFSLDALWFAGSGLAILLGGMLNIFGRLAIYYRAGRIVLIGANVLVAGFFAMAWIVLPQPQVLVGFMLFAALGVLSWKGRSPDAVAWRVTPSP